MYICCDAFIPRLGILYLSAGGSNGMECFPVPGRKDGKFYEITLLFRDHERKKKILSILFSTTGSDF